MPQDYQGDKAVAVLSPFEGWEQYPANLPGFDFLCENGSGYDERLKLLSESLFSKKVALHVIDANRESDFVANPVALNSAQKAEAHFTASTPDLRIIHLSRKNSLLRFRVTEDLLRKILTCHAVKTPFLDLLFGFRDREEISEKGYGIWAASDSLSGNYEICYQLRYMEPNNHTQGETWSERQIGVYHKFSLAPKAKGLMILLHAMLDSKAQKRLDEIFSAGRYNTNLNSTPLRLHVLIFTTYMDNWRWYMDDLGELCLQLENKGFTTEMNSKADRSLSFRTLQELRNLESKFIATTTILKATLAVLKHLEAIGGKLGQTGTGEKQSQLQVEDLEDIPSELRALTACSFRYQSYITSMEVMRNRVGKLIELLADGLNQKSQGTTAEISSSLLSLTKKSVDDNATVIVVTFITLIYLPTQFVATFFGMNFLTFQSQTSTIIFAKDFWIFIATAVPLTVATLGMWFLATHREKKGKEKRSQYYAPENDKETWQIGRA